MLQTSSNSVAAKQDGRKLKLGGRGNFLSNHRSCAPQRWIPLLFSLWLLTAQLWGGHGSIRCKSLVQVNKAAGCLLEDWQSRVSWGPRTTGEITGKPEFWKATPYGCLWTIALTPEWHMYGCDPKQRLWAVKCGTDYCSGPRLATGWYTRKPDPNSISQRHDLGTTIHRSLGELGNCGLNPIGQLSSKTKITISAIRVKQLPVSKQHIQNV